MSVLSFQLPSIALYILAHGGGGGGLTRSAGDAVHNSKA